MTRESAGTRVLRALDAAGVPHMLTGSLAASFHGLVRATQDIDLVIDIDRDRLLEFIRRLGRDDFYYDEDVALEALRTTGQFNVIHRGSAWKVDLICKKSRPFSIVEFERRQQTEAWGGTAFVATVEDLILAKLEWAKLGGSARQIEDASHLIEYNRDRLDRPYLEQWIDGLGIRAQWEAAQARA